VIVSGGMPLSYLQRRSRGSAPILIWTLSLDVMSLEKKARSTCDEASKSSILFFSELRYPVELQSVGGLGVCHGALLGHLFAHLEPLLSEVPPPSI
jgi:hypothetical protein